MFTTETIGDCETQDYGTSARPCEGDVFPRESRKREQSEAAEEPEPERKRWKKPKRVAGPNGK